MSSEGRKGAAAHAQTLPRFRSLAEAQAALIAKKNSRIASLLSEAASSPKLVLDFSVESLLRLEQWQFDRIGRHAADPKQLAESCAFYFGEVVVRTVPGAHWVVEEFVFERGRYEIGVRRGLGTIMLGSFDRKLHHDLNREHDSMWRTYHHYFIPDSKIRITF